MLSPNRSGVRLLSVCLGLLFAVACEKVPLLAPTGSTITLTAATNALSANGTAQIIAQVIEAAGTPPHSGTHITFTTTLGSIEPADATTDINGRALVTYKAGTNNGNAVITASSGGATTGTNGALRISVGTASVGRVSVSANPSTVSAQGGIATITANVLDVNGNSLTTTAVTFTTTAGSLSAGVAFTDQNGVATVTLNTSQQATVTASVGAQAPATTTPTTTPGTTTPAPASSGTASGQVVINVAATASLVIGQPATPPSKGLPATFTFTVTPATTNGSAVKEVIVDWGDGQTQSLGAVTGVATVPHVFRNDGSFTISATLTDAANNTIRVSTGVTVVPVPRPTVIVTPTPQTATVNGTITFNIQISTAAGIGVQSTTIAFGDGTSADLGGATSASVPKQYTTQGQKQVVVTVVDTAGQTTQGTTSVSITP